MQRSTQIQSGFTMIEVLLVLSISLILVASTVGAMGRFERITRLNTASDELVQVLRQAQLWSKARVDGGEYGVFFATSTSPNKYIFYHGDSYATRNSAYDREFELSPALVLETTVATGDVHFSGGLGEVSSTGTVLLIHEASGVEVVSINKYGVVNLDN